VEIRALNGSLTIFDGPASALLPAASLSFMERLMSVENIISIGLLGWLAAGIVLMGLDIW
jgi:hypothetical protein